MLVDQHRQNSSSSSAVKLVIVIYFRTLANMRLEDNEVFASDITDIRLQFHEPDAAPAPVTILSVVLQNFGIIESRAESPLWHVVSGLWHRQFDAPHRPASDRPVLLRSALVIPAL